VINKKWKYYTLLAFLFMCIAVFVNDPVLLMVLSFVVGFGHPYVIEYRSDDRG
jgi:hypothetical protein